MKLQERLKGDRKESELLKELNIPASKRIFIYGGNLGKPQGIDFLLKVIEENKKRDDSYFVIVGSGTEYMRVKLWFDTHLPQNACLLAALPKAKYDELVSLCDVGLIFLDKRFTIPNFPSRLLSYLECRMPVLMATDVNTDIGRIAEESGFGLWTENGNIDTFMENAIRAHCTVVVGGLPGVGKTEYVKYLTQFIPAYERVYTIEDNLELRYSAINPGKDCVEIKISDTFGYSEALKASKRQLPTWVLLAEARGEEVRFLMENISAGVHCLTTVHLDDVSKLPDRLRNMGQTINENDVYSFIDIGVQIRSVVKEGEKIKRKVAQVICLSREDEKNGKTMIYEDGKILTKDLPLDIKRKFELAGIKNPFLKENEE